MKAIKPLFIAFFLLSMNSAGRVLAQARGTDYVGEKINRPGTGAPVQSGTGSSSNSRAAAAQQAATLIQQILTSSTSSDDDDSSLAQQRALRAEAQAAAVAREEQRQAALKEQRSRTLADASEKIRQANEAKYRESLDNPFGSNDRPTTAGSDVNSRLAIRMAASSHSAAQSEEITRQKANTLSNPSASGECPTTLAHLAPQLPEYSHSELTAVRNQILIEDVEADYQRLLSQQISPGAAARTFLKNANESEKQRVVAMQCMRTVTNNADQMRAALENGTYRFTGRGIADSCAASYVNMYYGAVAMREMAIIVSCMAQRER